MKRPPPALRVGIVVAALALLGLAMCNRSKPAATNQPPTTQQQPPTTQQPEPPADAPQVEEGQGKMGKEPRHFPATKAPGRLY